MTYLASLYHRGIEFLRQRYRKFQGFPLSFFLQHPAVFTKGVLTGPFEGTRLRLGMSWNYAPNLLLGTYELELHPSWQRLLTLLDVENAEVWIIGAAEGYYVCALARLCAHLQIIAYEADPVSRELLLRNVRKNGVEGRVQIKGTCDLEQLHRQLSVRSPDLVISDIEGGEHTMFSDEIVRLLGHSALLIEVHPPYSLLTRVSLIEEAHQVEIVDSRPRTLADYPLEDSAPRTKRMIWMDERRPFATPWIVAVPREGSS